MSESFTPTAQIKMVIWDLDDTFWAGTLSEEGVVLSPENIQIVKTLTDRGIMSSIVSKNDLPPVRKKLEEAGIWDYFVFPKVSWNPKGAQIAAILEEAGLRPDNILFLDDNSINVEEARFRFPTMMVAYPQDALPSLLSLKEAAGKDDRNHSRLKQYKQLEQKVSDQEQSALSNVDFLRQCEIRIRFEFDVERHIDRIIELINRSNQLNYTKVRLEDASAIEQFRNQLRRHDIFAAGIVASDRYGSHGLIGFYMQHKNERVNELVHYVWSCRMMNSGLEQYVYDRLGRPSVNVVEPVSNPIVVFDEVDWVAEVQDDGEQSAGDAPRLLLIGSCDLTAVASYCSANRVEFVNGVKDGVMTRYDDFGFILGDGDKIAASRALSRFPAWSANEFAAFHRELEESRVLIVSLSAALKGAHCLTGDGVVLRVHPEGLGHHIDYDPAADYLRNCTFYDHSLAQKLDLLGRALRLIDGTADRSSRKFLLGANTRDVDGALSGEEQAMLAEYNRFCEDFCRTTPGWRFVAIDAIISPDQLIDDRHYSRLGYFEIAKYINARLAEPEEDADGRTPRPDPADGNVPLSSLIRSGRKVSRLSRFGGKRSGGLSYLKQAMKLSPLAGPIRKMMRGAGAS